MNIEEVRLGDICTIKGGYAFKSKDFIDNGIPLIRIANIIDKSVEFNEGSKYLPSNYTDKFNEYLIKKGDILVALSGATTGKYGMYNYDYNALLNQRVARITPNLEYLDPRYLFYYMSKLQSKILYKASGAAQPNISTNEISDFLIPLPSIKNQQKIVMILDKSKDIINKRKTQIKALDQMSHSIFMDMFGDPISNPKGWDIMSCKDISYKIGSGATPKGGNASYKDSGISLIRSMNIYNNYFRYKDLAFIDEEQAAKLNNVEVYKNDILLNITGASVARCCVVPDDILPARVNQHVSIIRVKEEFANYVFLNYLFINDSYQSELWRIATSGGATRQAITKKQIENLPIILPPLLMQKDFASKIEQINKQKVLLQSSVVELENLFNSLLQSAFNDELVLNE
ncbi:restriction endonuclease subunit S [Lederbergia ruris]|uniref:restriction endonuclease subunit S n=1 Tax=Lederbergia ruris TaxID=217495 RepID=UPI0039A216BA